MLNNLCCVVYCSIVGGEALFVDMKKWPPALFVALGSLRYDASLWAARITLLAQYIIMALGFVVAQSKNCLTFFSVFSVGFACLLAIALRAISMVLLTTCT